MNGFKLFPIKSLKNGSCSFFFFFCRGPPIFKNLNICFIPCKLLHSSNYCLQSIGPSAYVTKKSPVWAKLAGTELPFLGNKPVRSYPKWFESFYKVWDHPQWYQQLLTFLFFSIQRTGLMVWWNIFIVENVQEGCHFIFRERFRRNWLFQASSSSMPRFYADKVFQREPDHAKHWFKMGIVE